MCVHIIFSSVWVSGCPSFGKELLTRLAICSPCILTFVILVISRFGFEGWLWVLIALPTFYFYICCIMKKLCFLHICEKVEISAFVFRT